MLLLVAASVGTVLALSLTTEKYSATALLHVASRFNLGNEAIRADDIAYIDRLENTYSNLAQSAAFDDALQTRTGTRHRPEVEVSGVPNSELMTVSALAGSRETAVSTANAAAELLVERVATLSARPTPTENELEADIDQIATELAAARSDYVALAASAGLPPDAEARAQLAQAEQEIAVLQDRLTDLQSRLDAIQAARRERGSALSLIEPASLAATQSQSHLARNLAIAGIIGLLVAIGLAYLAERLRPEIHGESELRAATGAPILGSIPTVRRRRATAVFNSGSSAEDAFRRLRLALLALNGEAGTDSWRSLLITSPERGDGKTTVTANLGRLLASSGRRVLIVDGDMRNPGVHERFGVTNGLGFADLLKGQSGSVLTKQTDTPGLFVMPSGLAMPRSPGYLLERADLPSLLAEITPEYDYILVDSPPVLEASEALLYASATDGTILVVRQAAVPRDVVARAIDQLQAVNVAFVGLVVNRAAPSRDYVGAP